MKYFIITILLLISSCSSYKEAEKQFRADFSLNDSISTEYAARIMGLSKKDIIERHKNKQ